MSTKSDTKAPIKRLALNRETIKNLHVRTGVQTGVYVIQMTGLQCARSNGVAGTNVAGCRVSLAGDGG